MKRELTTKEKYTIWVILVVIICSYFIFNHIALSSAPHPNVAMDWEKNIPFIEIFILPYQSLYFNLLALFVLLNERLMLWRFFLRMLFILIISYGFFLFMPLEYTLPRPDIQGNWFIHWLFIMIDKNDLPYNQLPSLHVSSAVVYWYSLRSYLQNRYLKNMLFIWFVLIVLSTLFTYQHHFLDVVAGLFLGLVAVAVFNKNRVEKIVGDSQ